MAEETVGLVTGNATGVGVTVNPYIEYFADILPEQTLGVFGIGLILCGLTCNPFNTGCHSSYFPKAYESLQGGQQ